jgi:hypothetical protein
MVDALVSSLIVILVAFVALAVIRLLGTAIPLDAKLVSIATQIIGLIALVVVVIIWLGLLRGTPWLRSDVEQPANVELTRLLTGPEMAHSSGQFNLC